MSSKGQMQNKLLLLLVACVAVFAVVFIGVWATQDRKANVTQLDREQAVKEITRMINKKIVVRNAPQVKSAVDLLNESSLADELPVLKDEDLSVQGRADIVLEVFASPEKAGVGQNAWMVDVAKKFNKEGFKVGDKTVAVSVRNVTSGLGVDYIVSGVRVPDLFSPSSEFWGEMCKANGAGLEQIDEGIAGNCAGIVISNEKYDQIVKEYGSITVQTITDAVADGVLLFGYTTPNTSSTGLNFVMFSLYAADKKDPLSTTAIDKFTSFQANIPFVAQTTMQMQKAAGQGSLDAFVYESQVWENSPELHSKYKFVPFGVRHDNPVYVPSNLPDDTKQAAQMFIDYCKNEDSVKLATKYGFNSMNDYVPEIDHFDGATLIAAQKEWKENKDSGKTIVAVFVADVSGSMRGEPLNSLQSALINGMQYISSDYKIGLISYSGDVEIMCRIAEFDLNQQSLFKGAVESLRADGATATCDALLVAEQQLQLAIGDDENAEGIIFLLSDGDSNTGYGYNQVKDLIKTLGVPVYTIGYNGGADLLEQLSDLNEAANIDAESDDVTYKIKNLFNSNM